MTPLLIVNVVSRPDIHAREVRVWFSEKTLKAGSLLDLNVDCEMSNYMHVTLVNYDTIGPPPLLCDKKNRTPDPLGVLCHVHKTILPVEAFSLLHIRSQNWY